MQIYIGMYQKKIKKGKLSEDPLATSEYSSTETDVDCPRVNTHGQVKTQRWNGPKPTEIPLEKFQKAPTDVVKEFQIWRNLRMRMYQLY